jgi:fused signal recognition particle receptor
MVFGRLLAGLKRTREALVTGLRALLPRGALDAATLDRVEELLYTADLGPAAATLVGELRAAWKRGEIKATEEVEPFLKARILALLGPATPPPSRTSKPHVILVCGVNGSGKTTSIAKLAWLHRSEGRRVMLAACDTFRAAAVEQLAIWAQRLEIPIVKRPTGSDPSGLAFDAADAAAKEGVDILLVDTAGRLHTQKNLMDELEKIRRVLGRRLPGAPHEVLLVLDGTTGQNAIQQAEKFRASVEVTGLMVTKLDGTAKGGAVVSVRSQLGLPVQFIGLGEGVEDVERFDPAAFVEALFKAA